MQEWWILADLFQWHQIKEHKMGKGNKEEKKKKSHDKEPEMKQENKGPKKK